MKIVDEFLKRIKLFITSDKWDHFYTIDNKKGFFSNGVIGNEEKERAEIFKDYFIDSRCSQPYSPGRERIKIKGVNIGCPSVITGLAELSIISQDFTNPNEPFYIVGMLWIIRPKKLNPDYIPFIYGCDEEELCDYRGRKIEAINKLEVVNFLKNVKTGK